MKLRVLFQGLWKKRPKRTESLAIAAESQSRQSVAPESFSPDRPIRSSAEDRFNRWPFARRIAQAIANRADPSSLVIGIYGRYGEGKTSVLNLIRGDLAESSRFVVLAFNPWLFGDQRELLSSFFYTLADGLGRSLKQFKEEIGAILSRYSFALVPLKLVGLDFSREAKELGQLLSSVQLEDQRKRLEEILQESGKFVVVVIDDIDRLDRSEIQAIFKLVKAAADFDRVFYLLAFDDEMVAAALGEKFSGGGIEAGRAFLEKIIQVPLHLPPADQLELRQVTFRAVDAVLQANEVSLSQDEVQRFVKVFTGSLETRLTTPRTASRYSNAITFAVPQLHGEANIVDCLLVEGMRIFYPNLYTTVRANPGAFLGPESTLEHAVESWKKKAQEAIEAGLKGLDTQARAAATDLVQALFPRTRNLLGRFSFGGGLDELFAKNQRVGSPDYFWRFFQYAVPFRDLSDTKVRQFISSLANATVEDTAGQLRELAANNREERLIAKLRERERSLEPGSAERLALGLSGLGMILPNPVSFYPFSSPFSQAAILISNLVKRVQTGGQRDRLAVRIVERAAPVAFAAEILLWLSKSKDQDESERTVSADTEVQMSGQVADRVAHEAQTSPPYLNDPESAPRLFSLWFNYGDKEALRTYLTQRFGEDPKEAAKFLACYLPTSWALHTGLPSKGSISRETYDGVAKVIDPDRMIDYLGKAYGEGLDDEKFLEEHGGDAGAKAAASFLKMHRLAQTERRTASEKDPAAP